jgi:3-oxoacyl-[acyl-carrier-protein] synthase III
MADEIDPAALDWCARAVKLRKVEEALLMGEMVTEARFGEDMARYANASLADVKKALDEAIRNCQISRGETPKRTRYAMSGRMRPY